MRVLGLTLIAIFVVASAAHAAPIVSSKGYQLTPPAGWSIGQSGMMGADTILYLKPVNGFAPNINVVVVQAQPGENLKASAKQIAAQFSQMFTNYRQSLSRVTAFAGKPAVETIGRYSQGTYKLWMHQLIGVTPTYDYVFTVTGDAANRVRYEAAFVRVVRSVRFATPTK